MNSASGLHYGRLAMYVFGQFARQQLRREINIGARVTFFFAQIRENTEGKYMNGLFHTTNGYMIPVAGQTADSSVSQLEQKNVLSSPKMKRLSSGQLGYS